MRLRIAPAVTVAHNLLTATGTWTTCCALPFTETSVVEAATHERVPDDLPDLNGDPDVLHRTAARPSGGGCCSASDWSPSARVRVHDTAAEADQLCSPHTAFGLGPGFNRIPQTGQCRTRGRPPSSDQHARTAWPQLKRLHVRNRGAFAYVDGELADSEGVKLMRLHDSGTAGRWGFAGAPEEALDCACPLHLAAPDI